MDTQTAEVTTETATGTVTEGEVQTQENELTAEKPAPEVAQEKKDGEEQHRSRQWRRLDRWRQRAIEAETRLKLQQESQVSRPSREEATDDEPKRDQFDSYEEFIEAKAAYRADKAASAAAQKAIDAAGKKAETERTSKQQQERMAAWNAQVDKARDEIEDFEEVMGESDAPVTESMSHALFESDKGAAIAYHLAKNPAEAERISKLSPLKQAAAIFALEDKVGKPAKKPSTAPDPINPVGTKVEVQKDPKKMSQAEYNAWRDAGGK